MILKLDLELCFYKSNKKIIEKFKVRNKSTPSHYYLSGNCFDISFNFDNRTFTKLVLLNKSEETLTLRSLKIGDIKCDANTNFYSISPFQNGSCCVKYDEQLESPFTSFQNKMKNWKVVWEKIKYDYQCEKNTALSQDFAVLSKDINSEGICIGFFGKGYSFGDILFNTDSHICSIYYPLDDVILKANKTRKFDNFFIKTLSLKDGALFWYKKCANTLHVKPKKINLAGYCSWYHVTHNVDEKLIKNASNDFFDKNLKNFLIQIDDGYQIGQPDWSFNEKFNYSPYKLVSYINNQNGIPGIWIAPKSAFLSNEFVINNQDMLQRNFKGIPCIKFSNWDWLNNHSIPCNTGFFDPDHPKYRKLIKETLINLKNTGFKYFKIDFTDCTSSARNKYKKNSTYFESFKNEWKFYKRVLGNDTIINACIGDLKRPILGCADICRIGYDVVGSPLEIGNNIKDIILKSLSNGIWWTVDPDVYYLSNNNKDLIPNLKYLISGTQFIIGGLMLTSDLPRDFNDEQNRIFKIFTSNIEELPYKYDLQLNDDGTPKIFVSYLNNEVRIGVYNFTNEDIEVCVDKTIFKNINEYKEIYDVFNNRHLLFEGKMTINKNSLKMLLLK